MNGIIIDTENPQETKTINDLFLIGADSNCHWQLSSERARVNLPDRVCRIERSENRFTIRDLRSGVPTLVNNTQVVEAVLQHGDEIKIGNQSFLFSLGDSQIDQFSLKSKNVYWQKTLSTLPNISRSFHPVLLLGPSGSGKDVLAKAIHDHSLRRDGPLVSVNCSALTETLVESELFGHVKGSFTGAIADRKGAFEMARGGTLFLDEIGDLPSVLQAKLLRAIENDEIRPVGSDRTIKTDVRIIAATHQNLPEKIDNQQFRLDLYFRLNVITVTVPALKDRPEDFEDLLYQFAKKMRVRFTFAAIQQLKSHDWPGNIRELKNLVARASAYFPGLPVDPELVELILNKSSSRAPQKTNENSLQLPVIKEIERQMITQRLTANRGNQRRTALDLGMPKSTLHDRLKLYQIDPKEFAETTEQMKP